jgi:hypothetical protein
MLAPAAGVENWLFSRRGEHAQVDFIPPSLLSTEQAISPAAATG